MSDGRESNRGAYLWLALGAVLYVIGNGRWTIPLAAWLWPIFMLRFARTQTPLQGLVAVTAVFVAGNYIQWFGIVRGPLSHYITFCVITGIAFIIPFLVDRLIVSRLQGILAKLVFPLAWVTLEYLNSLGPNGTWGSLAYTQYGNLPLQQVVSVTGIYGITFLITWLAAVVNSAWEQEFIWLKIRGGAGLYICILVLIFLIGGARLAFFPADAKTVRVASVLFSDSDNIGTLLPAKGQRHIPPIDKTIKIMKNLSEKGSYLGAKIVNWCEYSLLIHKRYEQTLIDHACKVALKEDIYLLLAMGVFREEPGSRVENKLILVDPSGMVRLQYFKSHPVPREETPFIVQGERKIPILETPFGKIASVICFDLDFPGYMRQAGQGGADLLLGPSRDWQDLLSTHTQMTTFRAIENGCSFVRCTVKGLTIAVDHQGKTLSAVNYFRTGEHVIISDVPMRGVTTIYSKIGDLFAWLCCVAFTVIILLALHRHRRKT